MLKADLEKELERWKSEVEQALQWVEKQSYDIDKVKRCVNVLLNLVGRPNPPKEDE